MDGKRESMKSMFALYLDDDAYDDKEKKEKQ